MSYQGIGDEVKNVFDPSYSKMYRESDEIEVASDNHKYICSTLATITRSFGRNISALDLGCGSGRYFHCLQDVESLTAIDISLDLLKEARNPVKKDLIKIDRIELICANIFDVELPRLFDFIYSIGVLGEHSPFDLYVCNKLFDLLKPGGKLFFTVVDVWSKFQFMSWKRRLAESACPVLPAVLKGIVRERLATFYMTRWELSGILRRSKFTQYELCRRVSASPYWRGAHYQCIAAKTTSN